MPDFDCEVELLPKSLGPTLSVSISSLPPFYHSFLGYGIRSPAKLVLR